MRENIRNVKFVVYKARILDIIFRYVVSNSALQIQLRTDIYIQAYADKFILIVKDTARYKTKLKATEKLEKLESWSQKLKLTFINHLIIVIVSLTR